MLPAMFPIQAGQEDNWEKSKNSVLSPVSEAQTDRREGFHFVAKPQSCKLCSCSRVEIYPFLNSVVLRCGIFTLVPQSPSVTPSPVVGKECLSCRSHGIRDDWSSGRDNRAMMVYRLSMHECVCACIWGMYVCVPLEFVYAPAILAVNSVCMCVCVHVWATLALLLWRLQDTWHHTEVSQHRSLQDAGDSLTWVMRRRSEHQQAWGKLKPAGASLPWAWQ